MIITGNNRSNPLQFMQFPRARLSHSPQEDKLYENMATIVVFTQEAKYTAEDILRLVQLHPDSAPYQYKYFYTVIEKNIYEDFVLASLQNKSKSDRSF